MAAVFTTTERGKVRPPSIESRTMTFSLPAPLEEANATKTWFASRSSAATVGLARVLPLLQRSRPGTGQGTAVNAATVTGKPG